MIKLDENCFPPAHNIIREEGGVIAGHIPVKRRVVLLAEGSLDLYTASETPFTPQSAALHSTSDIASADRASLDTLA